MVGSSGGSYLSGRKSQDSTNLPLSHQKQYLLGMPPKTDTLRVVICRTYLTRCACRLVPPPGSSVRAHVSKGWWVDLRKSQTYIYSPGSFLTRRSIARLLCSSRPTMTTMTCGYWWLTMELETYFDLSQNAQITTWNEISTRKIVCLTSPNNNRGVLSSFPTPPRKRAIV